MKAHNLTICVPTGEKRCDKNCPYCISTITWQTKPNRVLFARNLPKVKRVADSADVSSILITGKGEPFLNQYRLLWLIEEFSDYWLEIQTNGIVLRTNLYSLVPQLAALKVNVIAFSIDKLWEIENNEFIIQDLAEQGIISRICVNVTDFLFPANFKNIMDKVEKVRNVRQVLFRNINYPSTADKNLPAVKWINEHVPIGKYTTLAKEMESFKLKVIRTIPATGVKIYDYNGISVCFSDYCVQESNQIEDIRSLIFQEDGHLYTNWNSKASILF